MAFLGIVPTIKALREYFTLGGGGGLERSSERTSYNNSFEREIFHFGRVL